jgi:hypothetical protein
LELCKQRHKKTYGKDELLYGVYGLMEGLLNLKPFRFESSYLLLWKKIVIIKLNKTIVK